jgi:hypothetical protein
MSYKAILLGLLLLLAVPTVSPAQEIFLASASGTGFCNGAPTKVKETLFAAFSVGQFIFANDKALIDRIATTNQVELFQTGGGTGSKITGGFIYNQDDADVVAMFASTFIADQGLLISFAGTLNVINRDTGCFENLTIKSKGIAQ